MPRRPAIALGALFLVMIHHLTDAGWSVGIRRFCEHLASLLFPWLAILFLLFAAIGVSASPVIVKEPASRTVAAGGTATFAMEVSQASGSTPPLKVQWRRNGQNIPGDGEQFLTLRVP